MLGYIDSSVVLRYILNGDIAIKHALSLPTCAVSELLEIECKRVIHRERLLGRLDDASLSEALRRLSILLAGLSVITLSKRVLQTAMGSFPVIVKTLDALHLASAIALSQEFPEDQLCLFSYDIQMNRCALALGFSAPLLLE